MAGRSDTHRQRPGSIPGLPLQPGLQLPGRAGSPTVLELRSVYQRAGTVPAAVAQLFAQLQPADAADLRPAELLVSLAAASPAAHSALHRLRHRTADRGAAAVDHILRAGN